MLALAVPAQAEAATATAYRGAQVHSLWWESSAADMDRELDLLGGAGANMVRVDVNWSSLETAGKGKLSQWYVDKLDRFMAGAEARGLKVIATLFATPCWASSAPATVKQDCTGSWWDRGVPAYPPTHAADYADVARWLAARHGSKLAALEVWNEPNLPQEIFWKTPNKAADYATLLKAAYPAAKQGDPNVPVLAGSLAFADRPFLDELYRMGIQGSYDGIAIHPYNEWRAPSDRWQEAWKKYTFLPGIEWIREGQLAVGDSSPIWITEFGWTTCSGDGWCVTEAEQADYIGQAFGILAGMDYVAAASVYNLRNKGTDAAGQEANWGLVRRDYSEKPAYAAFRAALTSAPPPASPTPTEPGPGSKSRGKGRKKLARVASVTVRRVVRRGVVYAKGRTRAGSRVRVVARRCEDRPRLVRRARANRNGVFRRRLGGKRRLRGCRLSARAAYTA
jgi:polysaccharide biosynthesis protein PslG